jgi:hypothetical protein
MSTHANISTCVCTHERTREHTLAYTWNTHDEHMHTHTCTHTNEHACTHTNEHACTHKSVCTRTQACAHTHKPTCTLSIVVFLINSFQNSSYFRSCV